MRYPLLYQLNTRVLLGEVGKKLGRPASLQDLSDAFLDDVRDKGFQWFWPLGVWQTGARGPRAFAHQSGVAGGVCPLTARLAR